MAFVKMSRTELYDKVWAEPMSQLAKAYGMSDVGLAKLCKRHDIPRPPRGYWAKLQFGKKPPITRLPNPQVNQEIELRDPSECKISSPELNSHVERLVAKERVAEIPIVVSETLRGCVNLVSQANEQLQGCRVDDNGLIILPKNSILALHVTKTSLRRSLLIVDALLKGLVDRGYEISSGPTVIILDAKVRFGISESLTEVRQELTDVSLDGPYEFGHSRFVKKFTPSGSLTLRIEDADRYWANGCRKTWRDGEKTKLEQVLNKVVGGLVEFAARCKQHEQEEKQKQLARQQEEQRRVEAAQQRAELRKQYKAESDRVEELLAQSKDWRRSRILRDYIEAAKNDHLSQFGTILVGSEFANWVEWATQQADRLDPLAESPPSILDTDPKDLEEPKRFPW